MAIDLIFPSFLYRGRLTLDNREFKREITALEKIDGAGRSWSRSNYLGGYSSYSSLDRLHMTSPNFAELERKLQPHIRKFTNKLSLDLMGRKLRMTTCWVNAMGPGTYHTMHMHPTSVLSGVYYVDVPAGSSPLKIEDPRLGLFMAAPPRKRNYLLIKPRVGQFLLFEGWMRHEVPPHQGARRRMSVSFNYEWI